MSVRSWSRIIWNAKRMTCLIAIGMSTQCSRCVPDWRIHYAGKQVNVMHYQCDDCRACVHTGDTGERNYKRNKTWRRNERAHLLLRRYARFRRFSLQRRCCGSIFPLCGVWWRAAYEYRNNYKKQRTFQSKCVWIERKNRWAHRRPSTFQLLVQPMAVVIDARQ